MIVHIIHTKGVPLKVYFSERAAYERYEYLKNLDNHVDYSIISMPTEDEDAPEA